MYHLPPQSWKGCSTLVYNYQYGRVYLVGTNKSVTERELVHWAAMHNLSWEDAFEVAYNAKQRGLFPQEKRADDSVWPPDWMEWV